MALFGAEKKDTPGQPARTQEATVSVRAGEVHTLLGPALVLGASLVVTVLISALSYSLLEKPFLRMKHKFTFIRSRPV